MNVNSTKNYLVNYLFLYVYYYTLDLRIAINRTSQVTLVATISAAWVEYLAKLCNVGGSNFEMFDLELVSKWTD